MKRSTFVLARRARAGRTDGDIRTGTTRLFRDVEIQPGKSNPNTAGNTPNIAFPSQIVVKQTATEISVDSTSVRQQPVSAVYKLDGSKVTVQAPSGISETGEAKIDGGNLVITSRRSFSSPAGDIVNDFKEVWTLTGNTLTIVKTRTQSGDSITEKAVYDKV